MKKYLVILLALSMIVSISVSAVLSSRSDATQSGKDEALAEISNSSDAKNVIRLDAYWRSVYSDTKKETVTLQEIYNKSAELAEKDADIVVESNEYTKKYAESKSEISKSSDPSTDCYILNDSVTVSDEEKTYFIFIGSLTTYFKDHIYDNNKNNASDDTLKNAYFGDTVYTITFTEECTEKSLDKITDFDSLCKNKNEEFTFYLINYAVESVVSAGTCSVPTVKTTVYEELTKTYGEQKNTAPAAE